LDLPYPGGPEIDRLAQEGKDVLDFPRAWLEEGSYDFSFSGLKSAVINYVHNCAQRNESVNKADVASSFQASVVDVLVEKTFRAAKQFQVNQVFVAGGVAANQGLRQAIQAKFAHSSASVYIPPISLCTDNAA